MTGDTVTVSLSHPIEEDGKTVSSLTLRRPLVRDLIASERQPGDIAQEAYLLSACSGLPFEAIGRMDAADYRRIVAEAELGFFSVSAGTQDPSGAPELPEASGAPSSSLTDGPAGASPTASA